VSIAPRRVFGVHVDGLGEGTHDIWVCRAHPGSDGIRIESIERLVDLPGGAADAAGAARTLVGKIREAPRSAWGFDAPYGTVVEGSAPEGGRRRTEIERGVEVAPAATGDWMQTQILGPLAKIPQVCVLPQEAPPLVVAGMPQAMSAGTASTYLLEVAPAALVRELRADGLELPAAGAGERARGLRELSAHGLVRPMSRVLRERAAADASAAGGLAALYCALAAWRGYRGYDHAALHLDADYAREGFIYC